MGEPVDLRQVQTVLDKHEKTEASLIPVLQEAQALYGYLPEEVLRLVGRALDIPLSRIYGVATFYAQFYLTPRGRTTVRVCRGTACHVRGGKDVLRAVRERLGVDDGETTADLQFSLETVACLGTCFLAPVMMVGRDYFGRLIPEKVPSIMRQYEQTEEDA